MTRKLLACLAVLTLALAGCAAVAVAGAATGIIFVSGEAKKHYVSTVDQAHQAVVQVMDEMGLPRLEEGHDGNEWNLRSRRPSDAAEVKIRVRPGGESLTEVGIRVGTWGDKEYSTKFLKSLERKL